MQCDCIVLVTVKKAEERTQVELEVATSYVGLFGINSSQSQRSEDPPSPPCRRRTKRRLEDREDRRKVEDDEDHPNRFRHVSLRSVFYVLSIALNPKKKNVTIVINSQSS